MISPKRLLLAGAVPVAIVGLLYACSGAARRPDAMLGVWTSWMEVVLHHEVQKFSATFADLVDKL